MVIEDLGLAINKMDELKDKERNSRNAEAQKQLREKVIGLEAKTHLIIELLIYLKERLGYNPSAGMVHNLLSINTALREAIQNDNSVVKDKYETAKQQFNLFQPTMQTEWVSIYTQLTGNQKGFLNAIESLHVREDITKIIGWLDDAQRWPIDKTKLKRLKKALSDVDEITETLNIGEEAQSFLEKVNKGEASLIDLSPSVLTWLKENDLERKMKLSF